MIVIFYSESPFLLDQEFSRVRRKLTQSDSEKTEILTFEGKEAKATEILQSGETGSLFSSKRLIVIKRTEDLKKPDLEVLAEAFESNRGGTTNYLILASKVDKRLGAWKKLIAASDFREFKAPKKYELSQWVQAEAKKQGKVLRPNEAALLVDLVGEDLGILSMTLKKLCISYPGLNEFGRGEIESAVSDISTRTIFELSSAIGLKNMSESFRILKKGFSGRDKVPLLISMVYRHFRILANLHDEGGQAITTCKIFRIRPFFLKDYQAQLRMFNKSKCLLVMDKLFHMDRSFKTSRVPSELLVRSFVREVLV